VKLPRGLVLPLAAGFAPVLLALVMFFEGLSLTAYRDTGGVVTICYGHTAGVKMGDVATRSQCMGWLWDDLQNAIRTVDRHVKVDVGWLCRVSLVDFVFNVGSPNFVHSTLLRRFNAGDRLGAPDEFLRWMYVGGKDCRDPANNCSGIVTRRQVERELCLAAP
jgi:lysozyme